MSSDLDVAPWDVSAEDYPREGALNERITFLLRYAVLAPSSHNTQPWRFQVDARTVRIFADLSGWLEVADPDKRELYLSLGCAIENLAIAARHFGFEPRVSYGSGAGDDPEAMILLEGDGSGQSEVDPDDLFEAITVRHTNHGSYDGRAIPDRVRERVEMVATETDIQIHLTDDPEVRERVDEWTVRADAMQFADPEWRRELGYWLGQGVFGQGWLLSRVARIAVSWLDLGKATGKKDRQLLDSASLLGVVTGPDRSRLTTLEAGRVFERLFLKATAEGLALQPMNQVLQVEEVRQDFERLLPAEWGRPLLTFRMGHAEPEGHTPRLPLDAVVQEE